MTHFTRHDATVAVGFVASVLSVVFCPSVSHACLAEYRSPDWLVGHSPLVFIGTVEKIEDGLVQSAKEGGLAQRESEEEGLGKPTIATVRIAEILKGDYSETYVRVGGGPCQSCGGDWYYTFKTGRQYIFILPEYPKISAQNRHPHNPQTKKRQLSRGDSRIGEVALQWGGSLLPLSETNLIESEIARLAVYRTEYLAEVQRERPKIYTAGVQLAERMRKEKVQWIAAEKSYSDERENKYLKLREETSSSLVKTLADIPVEAIRVAQALDWFSEKADPWWEQSVWEDAMEKLVESRKAEVTTLNEMWVRNVLIHANVERKYIDEYLQYQVNNKDRSSRSALTFPPDAPGVDVYSHKKRGKKEQTLFNSALTTDFILRYHTHYRGMMLPAYAGTFSAAVLAGLDPKRGRLPIASMYHGDNERLRWLAQQAIGYMPGTDFVDLPLDDMMENGKSWAWRDLDYWKTPKETAGRLIAMIDLVSEQYTTLGKAAFWGTLRDGQCFHPVCINKAIAALERVEKATPNDKHVKDTKNSGTDAVQLTDALRSYLNAAKAYRSPPKPTKTAAADYRQWFNDHPEKKEDRSEEEE